MTYGEIRLEISKVNPGVDLEDIDGWMREAYFEKILQRLSWKRLEGEFVIQVPPSYSVGTCTLVQGQNFFTVQGGGQFTAEMTGRLVRFGIGTTTSNLSTQGTATAGNTEYYQFRFIDATTGGLDRPYEGQTAAITGSTIAVAGMNYQPGDILWITGGNSLANLQVLTIGVNGAVATYNINDPGNGYAVATNVVCTGGSGAGFELNITAVGPVSNSPYRIDQNVFLMPDKARTIRAVRPMHDRVHPLNEITPGELNRKAPQRLAYGTPWCFTQAFDNDSWPPKLQLELYDIPSSPDSVGNILSFVVDYIFEPPQLDPDQTGVSLLPWVHTSAIKESVQRAIHMFVTKNPALAEMCNKAFEVSLSTMQNVNGRQRGPSQIRIASQYLGNKKRYYRQGPRHEGFTG